MKRKSLWNAIYGQPLWDSKSGIENQLRGGEKDRPLIWSESAIKPIQPAIVNLFKFYCFVHLAHLSPTLPSLLLSQSDRNNWGNHTLSQFKNGLLFLDNKAVQGKVIVLIVLL